MNEIIEPLGTIAEFSIGLAGFAGIVAAIRGTSTLDRRLLSFRFTNLLVTAFAPGFFAILSICLLYSGIEIVPALRACSIGLLLYLGAWSIHVVRNIPRGSIVHAMAIFMWVMALANFGIQVVNVIVPSLNLVGFYLFGLLLLLLQAAVVFATLVIATLKTADD